MRKFCLMLALCAVISVGQQLPNRPGLSLDEQSAWIVTTTRVSRQLNLKGGQISQIDRAFAAHDASQRQFFAKGGATEEQLDTIDHALAHSVLTTLDATQRKRLREIALQLVGPFALDQKDIADQVGLSSAQRSAVRKVVAQEQQREENFDNVSAKVLLSYPNATEKQKQKLMAGMAPERLKVQRAKRADEQKILNLLKPSQRSEWNGLVGERMP